jgi:hypothetical protein
VTLIENIIFERGPILSTDLIKIIKEKERTISDSAIRKRISRLNSDIYRIKGLFTDNQILYFKSELYGTPEYFTGLVNALKKAGKQYYTILKSLDFHHGYLKSDVLACYSINPVEKLKGHVLYESILERLKNLNLIYEEEGNIILLDSISENLHNIRRSKGIEVAKNFILIQFSDWSRKLGLVSYFSSRFLSEFGKLKFNFVGPSYIGSLPKITGQKIIPAFVIADILIGNPIHEVNIEFFISKIEILKNQFNLSPFIPFLIVDSLDTHSLNKLKSKGVVIGFINDLFGDKYKELLNSLINVVTNAGAILKKNPDAYLELINKLNKLVSGKTNNLRGDLFELAVGYYHSRFCKNMDIGRIINLDGVQKEIDVFSIYPNGIVISECKGYNRPIDRNEIDIWLGNKLPIIRKWILKQHSFSNHELTFEFWSTGGFTKDAEDLINVRKQSTKKYTIKTFNLEQMMELSKNSKTNKLTEILQDYYIKTI